MNRKISIALILMGLFVGYSLSTVLVRLMADPVPFAVEVGGNFGSPVTVTATGDYPSTTESVVDIEGDGSEIVEGGQALVRATSFTYADREWTQVADLPTLSATTATPEGLGELYDDVLGHREGTRLVVTEPDGNRATITVIDIMKTHVEAGEIQSLAATAGVPAISSDEFGYPQVDQGGGAVANLEIMTQVTGDGIQVVPEDTIYANYMLISPAGEVIESTFGATGAVPTIVVSEVFAGLQQAISDQRVGSRIVAAVPAALAQGETDLAIVIDILGVAEYDGSQK